MESAVLINGVRYSHQIHTPWGGSIYAENAPFMPEFFVIGYIECKCGKEKSDEDMKVLDGNVISYECGNCGNFECIL
jgi:hypothetical protein